MPWKESDTMHQRLQFVHDTLSERFNFTELWARYGVSRRIGYSGSRASSKTARVALPIEADDRTPGPND